MAVLMIIVNQHPRMLSPLDQSDGKVAFFGHSMGALLAFEVSRRFEVAGNPISALFVSASAAPARVTEDEEFAAKILPTLRGRLKAISKYDCPAPMPRPVLSLRF